LLTADTQVYWVLVGDIVCGYNKYVHGMDNFKYEFCWDGRIIRGTLLGKNCTFVALCQYPLEEFS
jgi:hypothetical protein